MSSIVPEFKYNPNQFVLHNATPKPVDLRWGGMQITIPPADKVCPQSTTFQEDGLPVPGTFVVQDGWAPDRDGLLPEKGSPPNWSAFNAVKNLLGIDPASGQANGVASQGGISFMPTNPTKEQYEKVVASGKARYDVSQVAWAQHQVSAFMERVQKAKAALAPLPPPDADYHKAVAILKKQDAAVEALLQEPTNEAEQQMELLAFAKAKALELAEKVAKPGQDKAALAKELAEDPEFLNELRKQGKFRIRKVGHLEDETQE